MSLLRILLEADEEQLRRENFVVKCIRNRCANAIPEEWPESKILGNWPKLTG
jgi:hypothetical protein